MTTSQLVTDTDLTLLGDIDLGHLNDAVGQLVTDVEHQDLALGLSIQQLVLLHIVDNQLGYQLVLMIVGCPCADMHVAILQVAQVGGGEIAALGDYLGSGVVLDSLRHLTLGEF